MVSQGLAAAGLDELAFGLLQHSSTGSIAGEGGMAEPRRLNILSHESQ